MRSVRCSAAHSRAIVDMLAIGCANQRLCGARSSAATASSLQESRGIYTVGPAGLDELITTGGACHEPQWPAEPSR